MRPGTLGAISSALLLLSGSLSASAFDTSGELDLSFGTDGIVTTDFGKGSDEGRAIALQPDGKILVAGTNNGRFALARFDQHGVLDPAFGEGGTVATLVSRWNNRPAAVNGLAVQADGRIVAAGSIWGGFVLTRHEADGSLNPSFGHAGIVRTLSFRDPSGANAVALQSDGRIVLAGSARERFAVARYLPDGTLDPSFGLDGKVTTQLGGRAEAHALVIQEDGRLVVAGFVARDRSRSFALVRYLPDGSPDLTFGRAGLVTASVCLHGSAAYAIALDARGRIVAAGGCSRGEGFALARFGIDGSIASRFGDRGFVTPAPSRGTAYSIALDADGTIVVAGEVDSYPIPRWVVMRLRSTGAIDAAFGEDGIFRLKGSSATPGPRALAVQADGGILVAGSSGHGWWPDLAVARLADAGTLDLSFGTSGIGSADLGGPYEGVGAVALQPDGMIVAAGEVGQDFGIARYGPSGDLDPSFGNGGKVITSFDSLVAPANALAILPDGRLLAVGGGPSLAGVVSWGFDVARYLPDGTLDPSFGQGGTVRTEAPLNGAHAVVVLSDDRFVVGGDASPGQFGLVRYLSNGDLDPTFGGDGVVLTARQGVDGLQLLGLILQPDGRVVAAGWSDGGFFLARYNDDGELDPSFGDGGTVITTFTRGLHGASALTIQPDGKLVAAGQAGSGPRCSLALARYNTDGSLDGSFGGDGRVRTDLGDGCERISEVRVQPDGMIVAVGGAGPSGNQDLAVIRYTENGSLDASFGQGGVSLVDISSASDWAYGLALQPDGKIVAAGISGWPVDWVLVRLEP